MLESQRIQLQISECRERLNILSAVETPSDAERAELEQREAEYPQLEARYRAALSAEAETAEAEKLDGDTAFRELVERAEVRDYLGEAVNPNRIAEGASAELRAEIMGNAARAGVMPWAALLPIEQRQDAATEGPTDVGRNQVGIMGRVFAQTAGAFLGVTTPSVPVGAQSYPVLASGTSAAMRSPGQAQDAVAATFTVTNLEPVRLSARYLFRIEDLSRLGGMEDALRADLRGVMGDARDVQILNGDGTAPNVQGLLAALTDPTETLSAVSTFGDFLEAAASAVDGLYATALNGVRILLGVETYRVAAATFRDAAGGASEVAISDYLAARSGGIRVSANLPDPASTIQQAIVVKGGAPQAAVAPTWEGIELLRDPYSGASQGEVSVTAHALWNFKVVQTAAYQQVQFKVA